LHIKESTYQKKGDKYTLVNSGNSRKNEQMSEIGDTTRRLH